MKKSCISLIFALLVLVLMLPAGAAAKTYYLTAISGTGVGTGTGETTFKVEGRSDQGTLREILANSYGRLNTIDEIVLNSRLLQDGDTLILPAGTYNIGSSTNTVYGNITIQGAGSGTTTLINATAVNNGRAFDLYNRYPSNFENGTVYNINLVGFTVYTAQTVVDGKPASSPFGIYLTGNNVNATLTDIVVEGFSNHCIGIWGNQVTLPEDKPVNISVKLNNVKTSGTGADIKLEAFVEKNGIGRTSLSIDDACEFASTNEKKAATHRININNKDIYVLLQNIKDESENTPRVNDVYVLSDGTLVPVNPPVDPAAPAAPSAPVDLPQTGDDSMLMLWAAACALAIAAFAAMKKSYNR